MIHDNPPDGGAMAHDEEYDPLLKSAADLVAGATEVHAQLLQDGLGVGFGRALRILDQLVEVGVLHEVDGQRLRARDRTRGQ